MSVTSVDEAADAAAALSARRGDIVRGWALGIDLGSITTRATLSDALKYGLTQTGVRLGTGG